MEEAPAWIELLFQRQSAGHALHSAYLLDLTQQYITDEAEAHDDGPSVLRNVSLCRLTDDDVEVVAFALLCLSAVGEPEDASRIASLETHPSDLIRRALAACKFGIRQAARRG